MAASEDFSLEVLWKRLTLTLREWEQKSEVSNPSGKDHEGSGLENPSVLMG